MWLGAWVTALAGRPPGYSYGFVFFRQRRDESIRRGFFQVPHLSIYRYIYTYTYIHTCTYTHTHTHTHTHTCNTLAHMHTYRVRRSLSLSRGPCVGRNRWCCCRRIHMWDCSATSSVASRPRTSRRASRPSRQPAIRWAPGTRAKADVTHAPLHALPRACVYPERASVARLAYAHAQLCAVNAPISPPSPSLSHLHATHTHSFSHSRSDGWVGGTRPAPRPGRTYELPFMGTVLHVTLPGTLGAPWDNAYIMDGASDAAPAEVRSHLPTPAVSLSLSMRTVGEQAVCCEVFVMTVHVCVLAVLGCTDAERWVDAPAAAGTCACASGRQQPAWGSVVAVDVVGDNSHGRAHPCARPVAARWL
jgi:hypothetical protein